ncbi:MAG: hypothetical protein RR190_00235, partial [Bacteroidales bacterium]
IHWRKLANVDTTASSIWKNAGNWLHPNGNIEAFWNGGAISQQRIYDQGSVLYKVSHREGAQALGLSANDPDQSQNSIDYAFVLDQGKLYIMEQGDTVKDAGYYYLNDQLVVEVSDSVVRYFKNQEMVYRSKVKVNQYPLFADISLREYKALDNLQIEYRATQAEFKAHVANKGANSTYVWYLNGTKIKEALNDSLLNTHEFIPSLYLENTDSLNCIVTSDAKCGGSASVSAVNPLHITIHKAQITITPNSEICYADSILLSAGGGLDYLWTHVPTGRFDTTWIYESKYRFDTLINAFTEVERTIIISTDPLVTQIVKDTIITDMTITKTLLYTDTVARVEAERIDLHTADIYVGPRQSTSYRAFVTDAQGCNSFRRTDLTVFPKPYLWAGNDTNICPRDTIYLSADVGGDTSSLTYHWYSLSGSIDTTFVHNYDTEGARDLRLKYVPQISDTYIVQITQGNSCTMRDTVVFTIRPKPADYQLLTDSSWICYNFATTLQATGAATSFQWSPSTGLNTTQGNTVIARPLDTTTYILTYTSGYACQYFDTAHVYVNPLPLIDLLDEMPSCENYLEIALSTNEPCTFIWSTGHATTLAACTDTIHPVHTQETLYNVIATDSRGCVDTAYIRVLAPDRNEILLANLHTDAAYNDTLCQGTASSVYLQSQNEGDLPQYLWYLDGIAQDFSNLPQYELSQLTPGTHSLSAQVRSSLRCVAPRTAQSDTLHILVPQKIEINAGVDQQIVENTYAFLQGTFSGGVPPYHYQWTPSDKILAGDTLLDPLTVNLTQSQTYRFTLTDQTLCSNYDEVDIQVLGHKPYPYFAIINITADSNAFCQGGSTLLHVLPSGGSGNYTYTWRVASGDIASLASNQQHQYQPKVNPSRTTIYAVQVLDNQSKQTRDSSITLQVFQNSLGGKAQVNPDSLLCADDSLRLSLSGHQGDQIHWELSLDQNTWSSLPNVSGSPASTRIPQTAWFRAVVSNGNCSAAYSSPARAVTYQAILNNQIHPSVYALCHTDTTLSFTGLSVSGGESNTYTYQWEYSTTSATEGFHAAWGDSAKVDFVAKRALTDTTWFRRIASDDTCTKASNVVRIDVLPKSKAGTIDGDTLLCSHTSTILHLSASTATHLQWQKALDGIHWISIPDATTDTLHTGLLTAALTHYRVLAQNESCTPDTSDVFRVHTTDNFKLSALVTSSTSGICLGDSAHYKVSAHYIGRAPTYQWYVNQMATSFTDTLFSIAGISAQDSVSCQISTLESCISPASVHSNYLKLSIHSAKVEVPDTTEFCGGSTITLTAKGGLSYLWSTGQTTASIQVSPSTPQTYQVSIVDSNACKDTAQVYVRPLPSIQLAHDTTVCKYTPISLSYTASAHQSHLWTNLHTGQTSNDSVWIVQVDTSTRFELIVVSKAGSDYCQTRDTLTVEVAGKDYPSIYIQSYKATLGDSLYHYLCTNDTARFTASVSREGNAPLYQWLHNGTLVGQNQASYIPSRLHTGDAIQCVLTSNDGCLIQATDTSNTIYLKVIDKDTVSIRIFNNSQGQTCAGDSMVFTSQTQAAGAHPIYQWYVNGLPQPKANQAQFTLVSAQQGDQVYCKLYNKDPHPSACDPSLAYLHNPAFSDTLRVQITTHLQPNLHLLNLYDTLCSNEPTQIIAQATNYGQARQISWYADDVLLDNEDDTLQTYFNHIGSTPKQICIIAHIESSASCALPRTASDTTYIVVLPRVPVQVSIESSGNTCANVIDQAAIWYQLTNVDTTAHSIRKTGGNISAPDGSIQNYWNAGAVSAQGIYDQGAVKFSPTQRKGIQALGLSIQDVDQHYQSMVYAMLLDQGSLSLYENGNRVGPLGYYYAGDDLRIETADSVVRYFQNDKLIYRSTQKVSTYPLYADVSLYNNEARLENVQIEYRATPVAFKALISPSNTQASYTWAVNGVEVQNGVKDSIFNTQAARPYLYLKDQAIVSVSVQAKDAQCVASGNAQSQITLQAQIPNTSITADTLLCYAQAIRLEATGGSTYSWEPIYGTQLDTTYTYETTYQVDTLVLSSHQETKSIIVSLNPLVLKDTTYTVITSFRIDTLARLTDTLLHLVRTTQEVHEASIEQTPLSDQSYRVWITDEAGCNTFRRVDVGVYPKPYLFAGADYAICPRDTLILAADAGTDSLRKTYHWYNFSHTLDTSFVYDPTQAQSSDSLYFAPKVSDTFVVEMINANACYWYDTLVVSIRPKPLDYQLVTDTLHLCYGFSDELIAQGSASSFSWSPSIGLSDTNAPIVTTSTLDTLDYILTYQSEFACLYFDTAHVYVDPIPYLSFADSLLEKCFETDSVQFQAYSAVAHSRIKWHSFDNESKQWVAALGLNSDTIFNPKASPADTTVYRAVTTSPQACTDTLLLQLNVHPVPTLHLAIVDNRQCLHSEFTVIPTITGQSKIEWAYTEGLQAADTAYTANDRLINLNPSYADTFQYTVIATSPMGCKAYDSVTIIVDTLPVVSMHHS